MWGNAAVFRAAINSGSCAAVTDITTRLWASPNQNASVRILLFCWVAVKPRLLVKAISCRVTKRPPSPWFVAHET